MTGANGNERDRTCDLKHIGTLTILLRHYKQRRIYFIFSWWIFFPLSFQIQHAFQLSIESTSRANWTTSCVGIPHVRQTVWKDKHGCRSYLGVTKTNGLLYWQPSILFASEFNPPVISKRISSWFGKVYSPSFRLPILQNTIGL